MTASAPGTGRARADAGLPFTPGPAWPRRTVLAAGGALALLAAAVRALARPGRPMWFDESITIGLARAPADLLLQALTHAEANGGLHTLLVRALLRAGDAAGLDGLDVARGLSFAAGVATVPALFLVGRRLVGDRAAAVAALLLALSRFHVHYSLEARGYALAVLLVVLSTGALLALLEGPRAAPALAFGLLAGLATWSHLFAAFVLAAQAGAALLHPALRGAGGLARTARAWLAAGLLVGGAGTAAVALLVVRGDAGQVGWIEPLSWAQVASTGVSLAGQARALLIAALVGAVAAAVAARRGARAGFGAALALAWCLGPFALAVTLSAVKPLLHPRYLLVALPGFLLLVALGLQALRRPRLVAVAVVVAAALAARELRHPRRGEPTWQPVDVVAARLLEVARPGDALVVSHPALSVSLERELHRLGAGPRPERLEPPPGDPLGLAPRPPPEARLAGRGGIVFVLFIEQPDVAAARAGLARQARVTADETLGGIRLLRLER